VSLSGAQAGIITDSNHRRARITNIQPRRILKELSRSRVVVVAGFQGMTEEMDVTTLGRGASDITAIALAARMEAARCERFTDVEGVFTADPRLVPDARKLKDISYDEMLELASYGAKVMHPRAVELGAVYKVPIFVASSFTSSPGTLIHGGVMVEMASKVRGIAHDNDIAKITVRAVPDRPGAAAGIFQPLSEAGVRVDTVVQNTSHAGVTDVTFTVTAEDIRLAAPLMDRIVKDVGARSWLQDSGVAKVSVVGACLENGVGHAARMFTTLFKAGVNIELITTSPIRITCIIAKERVGEAVKALHSAFALGWVSE
jgi:aspartate kinase